MRISLVTALRAEAAPLLGLLESVEKEKINGIRVWRGGLGPHEIRLAVCGIGPERTERNLALAQAILSGADLAVNFGVCGALEKSAELSSVVLMDTVAAVLHHQRRPIRLESLPAANNETIAGGRLVTHGVPVFDSRVAARLASRFDASYVDMEAWEVANFFKQLEIPVAVVKAVSDHADECSARSFSTTVKAAAHACAMAVHASLLAL
jgi:nucleoside phosphorylase